MAFGMLGLIIAGSGAFRVIPYRVSQHVNEFGSRIALGADQTRFISLLPPPWGPPMQREVSTAPPRRYCQL